MNEDHLILRIDEKRIPLKYSVKTTIIKQPRHKGEQFSFMPRPHGILLVFVFDYYNLYRLLHQFIHILPLGL